MTMTPRRRGLAKGLSALIDDSGSGMALSAAPGATRTVAIDRLRPGAFQPRRRFEQDQLDALAASIRDKGVVQPILVRESGDGLEIVAGERRWRAAQIARLHEVPVIVRAVSDREALEIAIIENLQRESLTAIEEAEGYRRLAEEFGSTQEELARSIGKSRSHIANSLRLLTLPEPVREMVDQGSLSAGHARALIGSADPVAMARTVVARGLNVRQTEKLAQAAAKPGSNGRRRDANGDVAALERDLGQVLGLKVAIADRGGRGELRIAYRNLDQLDDIIRRLRGSAF